MSLNPIKPCSKCLRARQNLLRMGGTPEQRLVQLQFGDVVLNKDHTIASMQVMPQDEANLSHLIGRRVYIAGKDLIDVTGKEPVRLADLGRIVKVSPLTA